MSELRWFFAKRLVNKQLFGSVVNMILTAYYVGYFHVQIVDHHSKIVNGNSARLDNHHVTPQIRAVYADWALNAIGPGNHSGLFYFKSNSRHSLFFFMF